MTKIFAAIGLAVAAFGMSGAAEARDRWDNHRHYERGWDDRRDHRWDHDRRWNRDRHWRQHRVRCWNEWHHHHRVRVCR